LNKFQNLIRLKEGTQTLMLYFLRTLIVKEHCESIETFGNAFMRDLSVGVSLFPMLNFTSLRFS